MLGDKFDENVNLAIKSFFVQHCTLLLQWINDVQIVKLLLNHLDIDVNFVANFDETFYDLSNWSFTDHFDQYFTPLHQAVEIDNYEIVKLLLNHPKILVNNLEIFDI